MAVLKKIPTWITGPFILMSLVYVFWFYVIIPFEHFALPSSTMFASFLFLPHFVRVFSVWYFGYRAFFGLVAGHGLGFFITTGSLPFETSIMSVVLLSSGSAVAALWLLDWSKLLEPAEKTNKAVNWRGLIFLGFLASLMNATGAALIWLDGAPSDEKLAFIFRILIGDTGSIIVGLILLMFVFRVLRRVTEAR